MAKQLINELQSLVSKLQAERQSHLDAVAAIDATFQALGISVETQKRGRRSGSGKKAKVATKSIKRRKFKKTANELVLEIIRKAGAKGATGAQITKAWQAAGRPSDAYNTLSVLLKAKKIKRQQSEGKRGSTYTAA